MALELADLTESKSILITIVALIVILYLLYTEFSWNVPLPEKYGSLSGGSAQIGQEMTQAYF